jgi:hypothetical protein
MPLLFPYGTLQDPAVQIATFGRRPRRPRQRLSTRPVTTAFS